MRILLLIATACLSFSQVSMALEPVTYTMVVMSENRLAAKGSCSAQEQAMLDGIMETELNAALNKNGFTTIQWSKGSGNGRRNNVRERELQGTCSSSTCYGYCRIWSNCDRRRLLVEGSEQKVEDLKQDLLRGCQQTLVTETGKSNYSRECRNAFAGSKCTSEVM